MSDPLPLDYAPAPPGSSGLARLVSVLAGPRTVWWLVCLIGLILGAFGNQPSLGNPRPVEAPLAVAVFVVGVRGLIALVSRNRSRWAYVYAALLVFLPVVAKLVLYCVRWPMGTSYRFLWMKL